MIVSMGSLHVHNKSVVSRLIDKHRNMKSLILMVVIMATLMSTSTVHTNPIMSSTSPGHFDLENDAEYNATLLVIANGGTTTTSHHNNNANNNKAAKMRQMMNSNFDPRDTTLAASASSSGASSVAQFNDRRRDMFLEDYSNSIKHIENSTHIAPQPGPQSSGPTIIVIQHPQPHPQPQPTAAAVAASSTLKPRPTGSAGHSSSPSVTVSVTPSANGGAPSITYTMNETKVTKYHQKEEEQHHREEQHLTQQEQNLEVLQSQRQNVLIPRIEPQLGRPSCVRSPDDTFCETVESYPKNAIKDELTISRTQFAEFFGQKEMDGRTSQIEDNIHDEAVCRKLQRMIYPQMAKNQANQWIYVVNEVEYTQAVMAEVCEKPGKACAYLDQNLPPGMYSRCKQKYSYKRLLALHPTEKRTYSDSFKFPSCCACYIKFDDVLARSGFRKIDTSVRPEVFDNTGRPVPNAETTIGAGAGGYDSREREGQTRDTRSSSSSEASFGGAAGRYEPAVINNNARSRVHDRMMSEQPSSTRPAFYDSRQTRNTNNQRKVS